MKLSLMALATIMMISGCTVVEVSDAGQQVRVVDQAQVNDCRRLSEITVSTSFKVGFIKRNRYNLKTELYDLARNEGAKQGGNRLVPVSDEVEGVQRFDLFQCDDGGVSR